METKSLKLELGLQLASPRDSPVCTPKGTWVTAVHGHTQLLAWEPVSDLTQILLLAEPSLLPIVSVWQNSSLSFYVLSILLLVLPEWWHPPAISALGKEYQELAWATWEPIWKKKGGEESKERKKKTFQLKYVVIVSILFFITIGFILFVGLRGLGIQPKAIMHI